MIPTRGGRGWQRRGPVRPLGISLLITLSLAAPALFQLLPAEANPDKNPLAMWVWDARVVITADSRTRLIDFCRRHKVGALYLSAYDLRAPMDDAYREFNRQAHRAGISVQALAGDPRWGSARYHHVPMEWVEEVIRFNHAGGGPERFDGIHADIEVYLLSKSWKEQPAALLGGYLDLNAKVMERLRAGEQGLSYAVDIPFWFDDDTSYRILWNGAIKVPAQHVLDTVDGVTVLAYRNFAEGGDGTVFLVSKELEYAEGVGKSVVIGQETQKNLYPEYVTFGGKSCKEFRREMEKIERVYGQRAGFGGFAIHHYDSYRELCGE
ncbi:MAG: hypothetical protein HYZ94_02015 [Candidatus Omnitrophica bacterium]|nr:hypothetical protein [Candidatus Omnitrophota bacterium]